MSEKAAVKEQSGVVTFEQLKDIMATVVAEARKPVLTDREQRDIEQQQVERAANAADQKAQIENTRAFQKVCSHKQDRGRAADKTAMVFVNQDFPGSPGNGQYLICQECGAKVVPGPKPEKAHPDFIYDTALFNANFQMIRFE